MLEDGFSAQLKQIAIKVRKDRHMMFFSATWPKMVEKLAQEMCLGRRKPIHLAVGQSKDHAPTTRSDITQQVIVFQQDTWEQRDKAKKEVLYAHLREVLT